MRTGTSGCRLEKGFLAEVHISPALEPNYIERLMIFSEASAMGRTSHENPQRVFSFSPMFFTFR